MTSRAPGINELASVATGRSESLFATAIHDVGRHLQDVFQGRSVLVAGAAGSIGRATLHQVLALGPAQLVLVDQSENGLAELVRDLHATSTRGNGTSIRTVLGDITSPLTGQVAHLYGRFDVVLNLAAAKHVRSERDALSATRMLQVNVLGTMRLMNLAGDRFFSVSTDKAAAPVSLMGASKRLMERVMMTSTSSAAITTCRFANVAFSAGSLPESWLLRIGAEQPLAVPRGIRRYFVSPEEAGQFCVLAASGVDRSIYVPSLNPELELVELSRVLEDVLDRLGLVPEYCESAEIAVRSSAALRREGRQAVVMTEPDTAGEKPYEEFVAEGEEATDCDMADVLRIAGTDSDADELIKLAVATIEDMADGIAIPDSVVDLIEVVRAAVPTYVPAHSERSLDDRL